MVSIGTIFSISFFKCASRSNDDSGNSCRFGNRIKTYDLKLQNRCRHNKYDLSFAQIFHKIVDL